MGMGDVPIAHDKDKDNGNEGGGRVGVRIHDNDDTNNAVGRGKSPSNLCGIRAIVLMNMGNDFNLAKLFCSSFASLMLAL